MNKIPLSTFENVVIACAISCAAALVAIALHYSGNL